MVRELEQYKNGFIEFQNSKLNNKNNNPINFTEIENSFEKFNQNLISLIDIQKLYSIQFNEIEKPYKDLVNAAGALTSKKNLNSGILSCQQTKELIDLLDLPIRTQWKLLYSGQLDGFRANDFHSRCDSKSPTLTIIISENGNIFGGFTRGSWGRNYETIKDETFIFSLKNQFSKAAKFVSKKEKKDIGKIKCEPNAGPIFGEEEIYICDEANLEEKCKSLLETWNSVFDTKNISDLKEDEARFLMIAGFEKFKLPKSKFFS